MSPINQEEVYKGKVICDFIELHRRGCTFKKDENDNYIYEPLLSLVNPIHIVCIDKLRDFNGCKIYFSIKDSEIYYETIEEVERLLTEYYEKEHPKNISSRVCMSKC